MLLHLILLFLSSFSKALCIFYKQFLVLTNCNIEATPTTVNSLGKLRIITNYLLSESKTTLNFYLYKEGIASLFPSSISSDKGYIMLEENQLNIQLIILEGVVNTPIQLTVEVSGFKNPSSNCEITFVFWDSITLKRLNINYAPTTTSLSKLTIIPDELSSVMGYHPLTLEITAPSDFNVGEYIIITEVTLKDNRENCLESVVEKSILGNIDCEYKSSTVTTRINSFSNSNVITGAFNTNKVTLILENVRYSSKMSPQEITVTTKDSNKCTMASTTDNKSWVPSIPASFIEFTVSYSPGVGSTTSTMTALLLSIQFAETIHEGQMITIEFLDLDDTITQSFVCSRLRILQQDNTIIKATTIKDWNNSITLTISQVMLPKNEKPFKVKITVYSEDIEAETEIVYEHISSSINATRKNLDNPGKVKIIEGNGVGELGIHSIIITPPYVMTKETELHYNLPSVYDVSDICNANENCRLVSSYQFIIMNLESVSFNNDGSITLTFSTINPPTTEPIRDTFQVIAYEGNYASFVATTTLDEDQFYLKRELNELQVISNNDSAYDFASYTISFQTTIKVIKDSDIVLSFPKEIDPNSVILQSVFINGVSVTAQLNTESLTISNAFANDIPSLSKIVIVLDNIRNPVTFGVYSEFTVIIQNNQYPIASGTGGQITINSSGSIKGSYILSNETNGVEAIYTLTLEQINLLQTSSTIQSIYFVMQKPVDIPSCKFEEAKSVYEEVVFHYNDNKYELVYSGDMLRIGINIMCVNPFSTQPTNPFIIDLFFKIEDTYMKITTAEIPIVTSIGSPLEVLEPTNNSPTYPGYETETQLKIKNNNIHPIHKLIITIPYPLLPAPSTPCSVEEETDYQCNFIEISNDEGNIEILFPSSWSSPHLTVRGIRSVNPHSESQSVKLFTVKTYIRVDGNYYVVDQADNAGKLKVSCDFPCKECSLLSKCTSCVDNTQTIFYFVPAEDTCKPDSEDVCGSGYFRNTTTLACDACEGDCKDCISTALNCTLCKDETKVLLFGECKDSCDDGYFNYPNDWLCEKCEIQCNTCKNAGDYCKNCSDGYFLYDNACLSTCPEKTFAESTNRKCQQCDQSKCFNCIETSIKCTSCHDNFFLESDSYTCVNSCGINYYLSGKKCIKCSDSCLTCSGSHNTCTSCGPNLYLHEGKCIIDCPEHTYNSGGQCKECSENCLTCNGVKDNCTSCREGKVMDGSSCVDTCKDGKITVSGVCIDCEASCQTCAEHYTYCTRCKNPAKFLYARSCYESCPENAMEGMEDDKKICVPCRINCEVCAWIDSERQKCMKCKENFVILEDDCVTECPSDYELVQNNTLCLPIEKPKKFYIPFPFIITSILFLTVPLGGWIRNPKSLFVTNIIIGWSFICFISFFVQTFISLAEKEFTVFTVSLISVFTSVILNIFFIIPYRRCVFIDQNYKTWDLLNHSTSLVISTLSYTISFQMRRLYYSRFVGLEYLFIPLRHGKKLLDYFSYFSMAFILTSILPICIIDVYGFSKFTWGGQYPIMLLETFIISLLMTILILYVTKYGTQVYDEEYSTLAASKYSTQNKELEEMRQQILSQVLHELHVIKAKDRLSQLKGEVPAKVQTEREPSHETEVDKREVLSFLCTPKTKEKAHAFFRESYETNKDFVDNIYFDSVSPKYNKCEKLIKDASIQTIPMHKLEKFRQEILNKLTVEKKLFESNADEFKLASSYDLSDPNNTLKDKANMPNETFNDQKTEIMPTLDKPLELRVKDDKNLDEENYEYKERIADYVGDWEEKDVFGSFDKDETDAILIMKTIDGKLLDKRGRYVNEYGYLIDDHGNIVSAEGQFIMEKGEFDREMEQRNFEGLPSMEEPKVDTFINSPHDKLSHNNKEVIEQVGVVALNITDEKQNKVNEEEELKGNEHTFGIEGNLPQDKRPAYTRKRKRNKMKNMYGRRVLPRSFRWNDALIDEENSTNPNNPD